MEELREEWEIEWDYEQRNNALVATAKSAGASDAQIACALARQNRALMSRLIELEAIAPMRIQLQDGTQFTWQCPDWLLPSWR